MTTKVAVLCWEQSRPWVSELRQNGFSVPWVDEPKGEVPRQLATVEPDVLVVDLTRLPEQGTGVVELLVADGILDGVPVVFVSEQSFSPDGLAGKVDHVKVTTPKKMIAAVQAAATEGQKI